jgi:hypothetical protein
MKRKIKKRYLHQNIVIKESQMVIIFIHMLMLR